MRIAVGTEKEFIWNKGEKNRLLSVYRPCSCGTCSGLTKGVGYLSYSDEKGRGFTLWLENEVAFMRLRKALGRLRRLNRKLRQSRSRF